MTIEIAGMAHVQLTVNDLERAREFYEKVLGYLGMRPVMKFPGGLYMVGGKTAVMITQSSEENRQARFDQRRIGLHHLCFRARSRSSPAPARQADETSSEVAMPAVKRWVTTTICKIATN